MEKVKTKGIETKYVEIKTKSQGGVEHSKFKLVIPPNPKGQNHLERRHLKAKSR